MRRPHWSAEEIAMLHRYIGKRTATEIGRMIGRTGLAVRRFAYRNGLSLMKNGNKAPGKTRGRYGDDLVRESLHLYFDERYTIREIGVALNIPWRTVERYVSGRLRRNIYADFHDIHSKTEGK